MPDSDQDWSFQTLLDCCGNPDSPDWEAAWRQLLRRYKRYMYKAILQQCGRFNHPQLTGDLQGTADDIFVEALRNICKNSCQPIRQFRNRHSEKAFLSWLASVCNTTTLTYIERRLFSGSLVGDIQDLAAQMKSMSHEARGQFYEDYVRFLRGEGKSARNTERDIHLFMLYTWADFSPSMVDQVPCFTGQGHRVLDDVIHRTRKRLRKNRNLF